MAVSGFSLGDTLLNIRVILQHAGIKEVIAFETLSARRKGSSFTTTYLVNDGKIESRRTSRMQNMV